MIQSDLGDRSVNLFGNGKSDDADADGCDGDVSHVDQGEEYVFKQGDRIGFLLDLDAGWLRSGVTGPLLRCVEMFDEGNVLAALPGAEMPADAGL